MSLDDDDTPATGPAASLTSTAADVAAQAAQEQQEEEEEEVEGLVDFRLFKKNTHISAQTIRKGEKDFESHGTRAQENALEQSRRAMVDVLSYTRVHTPQNWTRGWLFPDWWATWPEEEEGDQNEGLVGDVGKEKEKKPPVWARDRAVILEGSSVASMNLGRAITGQPKDRPGRGKDWLLPEEALYLLERGSLDLWWPSKTMEEMFPPSVEGAGIATGGKVKVTPSPSPTSAPEGQEQTDGGEEDESDEEDEYKDGIPLSIEAAYSLLIGKEGERGKVSLQKFQVFSNLKRAGFNVLRAPRPSSHKQLLQQNQPSTSPSVSFFSWLTSLLLPSPTPKPYGPLVQPGLYRSYVPIYRQLSLLPRHKPSPFPTIQPPPPENNSSSPFTIHYHIWKSTSKWSKLRHGPPDFYISVVDAQDTSVPSLEQISSLIDATPYAPPKSEWTGPGRLYARLKNGWRNVLVAVVDHGVINYMRFGEGCFGEEELFERFDGRGMMRGGKRGGGNNGRGSRGGRGGGNGIGRGRGGGRGGGGGRGRGRGRGR